MNTSTDDPLLTLSFKGYPFANGWEITAQLGMNDYIHAMGGPGIEATRTQFFKDEQDGSPDKLAMQVFHLILPTEAVRAFPGVVFGGGSIRPGNQGALEMLMAEVAKAGVKMLIGCLRDHPNPAVREQFIRAITCGEAPLSSLL